ncbi:MAG: pilus assembly protein TadC, partial [Nitrosopumilaceae archaeon]|nr:pilus assembly protein TadC [Nitrosopumilaceae archaeon]
MSTTSKKKKIKDREQVGPVHIYSYKLLNERAKWLYPKFSPLQKAIKESMMPIPFEVYVCSMVFFSMLSAIGGGAVGAIVMLFVNVQPAILGYLIPVAAAVGFAGMTFLMLNTIPPLRVKSRSAKLMEEIPHFIGYMSTLATSGLTLEGIFKALAREESDEEMVQDARLIVRNLDIMGM